MRIDAPGAAGELERRQRNFHGGLPPAAPFYALFRPSVGDRRLSRRRRLPEAQQVREELIRAVRALRQLPPEVQAVYGYFNDDYAGFAPGSALMLKQKLGQRAVDPQSLWPIAGEEQGKLL